MSDKARELLERASELLDGGLLYRLDLQKEIRAYLAEQEYEDGAFVCAEAIRGRGKE